MTTEELLNRLKDLQIEYEALMDYVNMEGEDISYNAFACLNDLWEAIASTIHDITEETEEPIEEK